MERETKRRGNTRMEREVCDAIKVRYTWQSKVLKGAFIRSIATRNPCPKSSRNKVTSQNSVTDYECCSQEFRISRKKELIARGIRRGYVDVGYAVVETCTPYVNDESVD
jgi:hypothetical protein